MIARRLTVINIVLLVACTAVAVLVVPRWIAPPAVDMPTMEPGDQTGGAPSEMPSRELVTYPPFADFASVADKNLFHPDRTFVKASPVAGPPPERPSFVLYGVIEAGSASVAMLEDPKAPVTTAGHGKRTVSLRIGERLAGYRLDAVASDSIVMVYGDERITIPLVDPQKPKHRTVQAAAPAARATAGAPPRKAGTPRNLADAFRIPKDRRVRTSR